MNQSRISVETDTQTVLDLLRASECSGTVTAEFGAHHVLFEPDDPAERVFYLLAGEVRVLQSINGAAERLVSIQGRGSWIGLAPLTDQQNYGFRAVVHRPSTLLVVPAAILFHLIDASPKLASIIVRQLASRLLQACTLATRLSSQDSDTRIIQTLLELVDSAAAEFENGDVILRMTHQDLAKAVGLARETVSVALIGLREQQLLRTKRNHLSFNPELLRQFAASRRPTDKRQGTHDLTQGAAKQAKS